jgi:hypothetical protein
MLIKKDYRDTTSDFPSFEYGSTFTRKILFVTHITNANYTLFGNRQTYLQTSGRIMAVNVRKLYITSQPLKYNNIIVIAYLTFLLAPLNL